MTTEPLVADPSEKDGLLVRLSRFSFRRRKLMVFGIWLPIFLIFNTVSGFMGVNYHTTFNLPNSDTQFVQDALVKTGDREDAGYSALIVFASSDFADDATRLRIKSLMEPFLAAVDKLDGVKVVSEIVAAMQSNLAN